MLAQDKKISRRDFLKLSGNLAIGSVVSSGFYASLLEPNWLDIERITIPLRQLPSAFDGMRIAQLSDIHLSPFTPIELIEQAVETIIALQPDIVVLTGDYVYLDAAVIADLLPVLEKIVPRLGTFAIVGNHDIWTDIASIENAFDRSDIMLLRNQALPITQYGQSILIAGVDDAWVGNPNLTATLAPYPSDIPTIVLEHEPDVFDIYRHIPQVMLQLSGHSHGGQVRFPGLGPFRLPFLAEKYHTGLYEVNNTFIYTNRGLGVTNLPIRFACRPEVTLLTLTQA